MYWNSCVTPIRLEIKRHSTCRSIIFGSVYLVCIVALHSAGLSTPFYLLAIVYFFLNILYIEWLPVKLQTLIWQQENHWLLIYEDGTKLDANLKKGSVINRYFAALEFFSVDENRHHSVFACYDMFDPDEFRRLRLGLSMQHLFQPVERGDL